MSLSDRLKPATAKAGTAELMACLTLVAPSGMSAEDRKAWIAVAKATLSGMPADLLVRGCRKARESCRFASEIVPTIMETVEDEWRWRRKVEAERVIEAPRLEAPEYVTAEEVTKLIRSLGMSASR